MARYNKHEQLGGTAQQLQPTMRQHSIASAMTAPPHICPPPPPRSQVPLVVLSDAPIPADSTEALDQQNYWGINVTLVETALSHLLGEGQEVSVARLPAIVLYTQYSTLQRSASQYCNSAVVSS
jgi:hypothetical protein